MCRCRRGRGKLVRKGRMVVEMDGAEGLGLGLYAVLCGILRLGIGVGDRR